jgi:cysteine desulfurase/selenocysteine lyase
VAGTVFVMLDTSQLIADFPILGRSINDHRLVYLDTAATSQKPLSVLAALTDYYQQHNANTHRGVYRLAEEATELYEQARRTVQQFIKADSAEEIVFVRGATEGLNLLAFSWGLTQLTAGDEIVLSEMEHHANLLPWQRVAQQTGAVIKFIPVSPAGQLLLDQAPIGSRTKLVAITHVSNVLGTVAPVKQLAAMAHAAGAVVVVDAAQSVPHMAVDVGDLGADFLVFSGHKMLGPTGIGVLYGRRQLLQDMPPFLVGGEMIKEVTYQSATWHDLPHKFEAGTPHVAGAVGLAAAIEYLNDLGLDTVQTSVQQLVELAVSELRSIEGVTVYGPDGADRCGLVSFNVASIHAHDLASLLDEQGVAIRSGHHCAQPLINKLGLTAAARASFYIYNTPADVAALIQGIRSAQQVWRGKANG